MNKTQAMAALKRLYGKKAMWRYDERAPTADQREEVREKLPALRATQLRTKAAMEARRAELLLDPEYVRLRTEAMDADKAFEAASSTLRHYRVTVGRSTGFAFMIEAQGDNWQDAIDKARTASVKATAI